MHVVVCHYGAVCVYHRGVSTLLAGLGQENGGGRKMNGSLYISFFQGQLESALEQVVQLAVTEITGTVGLSLGSMLLETARKEQDNQRLRAAIQTAGRADSAGLQPQHAAAPTGATGPRAQHALCIDSLRLGHKRRAVGQLKVVMERVLEFGVRELSKVVEDSFDDVLLELRKTEQENEELLEKLRSAVEEDRAVEMEVKESQGEREESPTSADGVKDKEKPEEEERETEKTQNTEDSAPPAVISVSQDWVPVLDQVFGQKWCADIWPVKDGKVKAEPHLPSEEPIREDSAPLTTDNSQSDQQQWLQETGPLILTFDPQQTSETSLMGDDVPLKSPSMLQRLLTLPSQLLEDEEETMESEEHLLNAVTSLHGTPTPQRDTARAAERNGAEDPEEQQEEEQEEEGQEETKSRSCRSGRKNHACKTCGRKFSRAHLLKAHRLTHKETRSPFSKLNPHAATNSRKNT